MWSAKPCILPKPHKCKSYKDEIFKLVSEKTTNQAEATTNINALVGVDSSLTTLIKRNKLNTHFRFRCLLHLVQSIYFTIFISFMFVINIRCLCSNVSLNAVMRDFYFNF